MLASDSDSDFEYPADGNNSEASDDCILLGKLALGIDSQDLKAYDGKSTPQNGSQYLMKVMAEKKSVPKVVSFDTSKLSEKRIGREEQVETRHYLDRFLQGLSSGANADGDSYTSNFLPSTKWREETVANFSEMRSKIEKWKHMIESRAVKINNSSVILPQSNDNMIWLKCCFGEGFMKLAAGTKTKTKEQKLCDFFSDLYDPVVASLLVQRACDDKGGSGNKNVQEDRQTLETSSEPEEQVDNVVSGNEAGCSGTKVKLGENSDKEEKAVTTIVQIGERPLMTLALRLSQYQLENLVKWNLLWIQNTGFVNECQGQWLYAVLACLVKPLDPSVMSDLRCIARGLIKTRSNFSDEWRSYFENLNNGTEGSEGARGGLDEKIFDYINTLNLFIYIIADYFQQKDLVMHL